MATFRDLANRQHGPSRTDTPFLPCPECGAALDPQTAIERFDPRDAARVITTVRVALCTACDFVHEF